MTVLVTGSAGRVGRTIAIHLMQDHKVVGLDATPCSTADIVGDIRNPDIMDAIPDGLDVIIHTAALHAPHVGLRTEAEFRSVNVDATEALFLAGLQRGMRHFIFTSTTALYGQAAKPEGEAGWVDETITPRPRTIYHLTKIAAEQKLEVLAHKHNIPVTVLQMSRCFPEPADMMAVYRLHRGIDARDVATAHRQAVVHRPSGYTRYIVSGATPFQPEHCMRLLTDAPSVLRETAPDLVAAFAERSWPLPGQIDRVYDSSLVQRELGWEPKYGFQSVIEMLDHYIPEVLPVT